METTDFYRGLENKLAGKYMEDIQVVDAAGHDDRHRCLLPPGINVYQKRSA